VPDSQLKVAVVGHVEWVQFGHVRHLPRPGEVAHASGAFEEPAGGGAVAAVQLARLAGTSTLFTVLGEDDHGRRTVERLRELGVSVLAEPPTGEHEGAPTRRAVTLIDDRCERTITTFGERLDPAGGEGPGWGRLSGLDAVYFTAGDLAALRMARNSTAVLVANPRARHALGQGVPIDALILSGDDEVELREAARAEHDAELVLYTEGERGGRYRHRDGTEGRWQAAPVPGPVVDSYGCGDSFAGGFAYALGAGMALPDALALASRCGAQCLTGAGPYGRQLSAAELRTQRT
jgi:ribokinase